MRKAQDDPIARSVAENQVADISEPFGTDESDPVGMAQASAILGAFKAVEFETTSRKVGDEEIPLRRLVITGPWEVNPSGK